VNASNAATYLPEVAAEKAVTAATATSDAIIAAGGVPQVSLFGVIPVTLQGYQGHVIPVVVAVFLMCKLEKYLHEHVPDMFDLFVTPLVTVLVTGLATMVVIGPIFSMLEEYVMKFFQFLLGIPFGLGGALAGAIYPFTVVLGVHHMFNALEASLVANGADGFNPIISAANVAQGAACFAVFVKTASAKKKGLALPSGLSSLLGITEPAIYGVNLPAVKPFIGAVCGAAAGGLISAMFGLYSIAYGITGIFGYLITANAAVYTIVIAVAFAVSFAVTFMLYSDDEKTNAAAAREAEKAAAPAAPTQVDAVSEPGVLASPMTGNAIAMTDAPDAVFASLAMGNGAVVEPTAGEVYSPIDGTVTMLFDTKHAIGLAGADGTEVLIHIGVDTVELAGGPFEAHVAAGDTVKAGQLLITADLDAITEAGKPTATMVIVTNTDDYASVEPVLGATTAGAKLVTVTK
jgi:PTS system sucrose-specific IIC component